MSLWFGIGRFINKIVIIIAGISLVVMMLVVVFNIFSRGFFSLPIMAAVEIVGLAGVFLISFAIGFTEHKNAHIIVRMMISRLPLKFRLPFNIFTILLSLCGVALLIWGGLLKAWEDTITPGATTYVLRLNRAPFKFTWLIGCIILLGFLLRHLFDILIKVKRK